MATLMVLLFLLSQAASELTVVEEQVGQDVTLPCQAVDGSITAVEWTRPDLTSPEYVLLYSDGHPDTAYQHPSFKGRVELMDNEMKDGNVSVILRKVNSSDEGTYECRVTLGGSRRNKRAVIDSQLIETITLKVTGPQSGDTDKDMDKDVDMNGPHTHVGLIAAVVLVCLAAVVGSFAVWKSKKQQNSEPPAADEASGVQLV